MISKQTLKKVLLDGMQVENNHYSKHPCTDHVRTFYFFCKRLVSEPANTALSSPDLNAYIFAELGRRKVVTSKRFNPHGFFGKGWTDWEDQSKNEKHFKNEYFEVLLRSEDLPYSYQIKPEYFEIVREIFTEFKDGA